MIATNAVTRHGPIRVPTSTSQNPATNGTQGPKDAFVRANAAVEKLRLGRAGADSALEHARNALDKLGAALAAFGGAGDVESAMARVLKVQSKSSSQNARTSEGRVKAKYEKLEKQTEARRKAIRERVEAEKDKSFWDKLVNVFDSAGKCVVGAATGCVGGVAGMIGGALLISSVIVANTVQNRVGGWVAAGLATAGGAMLSSLGGLIAEQGLKQLERAREVITPLLGVPKSNEEKKVQKARARLQAVNTEKAKLEHQATEARDDMKTALEGMIRSLKLTTKVFEQHRAVQNSALQ